MIGWVAIVYGGAIVRVPAFVWAAPTGCCMYAEAIRHRMPDGMEILPWRGRAVLDPSLVFDTPWYVRELTHAA